MSFISPSKVFAHLEQLSGWQKGEKPAPVTVELDLSNRCSLGCFGCHMRHTHVAGPWATKPQQKPKDFSDTGSLADEAMLQRVFGELSKAGVKGLVLSGGGEPTLHPDFDVIAVTAYMAGLQIGMYTLGGHLPTQRAELVKELFKWTVVSLDCPDAETYSKEKGVPPTRFHAACEGIRAIVGGKAAVGVSFLLHAGNWTRTAEMLALSRSLGATYTTFRPTIKTAPGDLATLAGDRSWVTDALPTLWELHAEADVEIDPDRFVEYRDWAGRSYKTCYGIRMVTQVTPDGRVWVCPNRRGIAGSELGDLTKESFAEIWARHPGQWTDFSQCRAMCRLNLVNSTLSEVFQKRDHEAFV